MIEIEDRSIMIQKAQIGMQTSNINRDQNYDKL
jgi:hypothetical protein